MGFEIWGSTVGLEERCREPKRPIEVNADELGPGKMRISGLCAAVPVPEVREHSSSTSKNSRLLWTKHSGHVYWL